ncbi:hypothetical protein D9758_013546 [Tetrapyrgos nigripes]|uniref:Uncharacterized protein n=1 Tax=Tetrapyrgos nigripes TaxID=182062 RepID=A0A8H5CEQ0_9AGAR|nr:hypothetical protein D9758_013546 [Tetrapyrgos nigripes]
MSIYQTSYPELPLWQAGADTLLILKPYQMPVLLSLFALLVQRPALVTASTKPKNLLAAGYFLAESVCGPADSPMSDLVNLSSMTALEEATFGDYKKGSVSMTFESSNNSALSGSAADAEWDSFFPKNKGFISQDIENNTVLYSISGFHAMHCLDTARRVLEVHYNVASDASKNKVNTDAIYGSFYHLHHCLIYLREMVTCSADPVLKHIYFANGTASFGGDGTKHECRDFNALYNISDQSHEAAKMACGGSDE